MIRAAYSGVVQFIFDGSIRTAHLLPIQFSARLVAAVNEPSPRLSPRPPRGPLPRRCRTAAEQRAAAQPARPTRQIPSCLHLRVNPFMPLYNGNVRVNYLLVPWER